MAPIVNDRAGRTQSIANAFTLFNDLYLAAAGILVAAALNGAIRSHDPRGLFDGPSVVLSAAGHIGLSDSALIVIASGNRVSVFAR